MADITNLPADISPAAFFTLVEQALASEPAPAGASPDKLQIYLEGDDGGAWTLGFVDGALKVVSEDVGGTPLQVSLTVDDWRALVAGSVRDAIAAKVDKHIGFDPETVAQLYQVTYKTEQIKALSGDLQIVIEDKGNGNDHKLTLTFGGGEPKPAAPTTTVSVDLDDFIDMANGEVQPQAAFFMGKIRLDGDMNLAMSLMALAQA
ncbi:MAG: hypothetical protein CSA66_00530 [Proteobacteria bacterium]|nr:MAG: hypothetical protein CSA66_00530 [Pseudomonadota bacterium]